MALTFTFVDADVFGSKYTRIYDITLDSAYPAGGYAIDPTRLGLSHIMGLVPIGANAIGAVLQPMWDTVNKKLVISAGGGGLVTYVPGGGDIKGSENTNSVDTDQAAKPTNADYIDTLHAVAAGAWAYSEDLEPDVARNVVILLKADAGGSTVPATLSFLVTGTFRGEAQSDTITFSFADTTLAASQHRYKYGVKPFDTITNVVPTGITAGQNDLLIGVGLGSLLGLPQDPATGTDADMIKITKNGADLAVAGLTSFTNNTVNLGSMADAADVSIQYIASGQAIGGQALTGAVIRAMAIGV